MLGDRTDKTKLTEILTKFIPDRFLRNINTDMPTSQAVRLQMRDELLGAEDGYALPHYERMAQERAAVMWSFQRKSRGEAVAVLDTEQDEHKGTPGNVSYWKKDDPKDEKKR
jgi:hypothetical protein